MEFPMDFREFVEGEDTVGESIASSLGKGILAGAVALSALGGLGVTDGDSYGVAHGDIIPQDRELQERLKDKNRYYSVPDTKKLVKLAQEGDDWAVREIAWPKDHPLHKKGRPFFRNDEPHPKGLFPDSGH